MRKKIITTLFALYIMQITFAQTFRVVGYLPYYRWEAVSSVNYESLTHICPSFINPDENGNFSFPQDLTELINLAHAKNCKVMASIGGGVISEKASNAYKTLTSTTNRPEFIHKLMNFVRLNKMDGIDVDLEGSLVQMSNYNAFIVELADSVHAEGLEISAAWAKWTNPYVKTSSADALDFINMMSYDQKGSWAPNNPGQHSSYYNAVDDFNYWIEREQAADKIVLGVPFYGYDFKTNGRADAMVWCEIASTYPNNINDDQASTPGGTVYYNGKTTIKNKTQFMLDQKGGGIMIWELGQDCNDSTSLLELISETISIANTIVNPTYHSEIIAYPNPVENELFLSGIDMGTYQIIDINGKIVKNGIVKGEPINVSELLSGTYILKVVNKEKNIVKMFIK